jgi:uncharacterized integral membrane protein
MQELIVTMLITCGILQAVKYFSCNESGVLFSVSLSVHAVWYTDAVVREFLTRFPYSLPCLVNLLLSLLAGTVVAVWMPETLCSKT